MANYKKIVEEALIKARAKWYNTGARKRNKDTGQLSSRYA
jgi:hypothetical protein